MKKLDMQTVSGEPSSVEMTTAQTSRAAFCFQSKQDKVGIKFLSIIKCALIIDSLTGIIKRSKFKAQKDSQRRR